MLHEISNLISRKNYWKHLKYNLTGGDKLIWAIFEWIDVKPFLYSLLLMIKTGVISCLKRIKMH